jgi:hypothetical protein
MHQCRPTLLEYPDATDTVAAHIISAHSNIRVESVGLTTSVDFGCHLHRASGRHAHSIEIMRRINPCSTGPKSFEAIVGWVRSDHVEVVAPVTLLARAVVTVHLPASLRAIAPCQTVACRQGIRGESPAAKHRPIRLPWTGSCSMEAWRVVACRLQLVHANLQPTPFSADGIGLFLGRLFTALAYQPTRAFALRKVEPGRACSHVPGSCGFGQT